VGNKPQEIVQEEVVIMSISQISPNSLTATTPYANPYARTTEAAAAGLQQDKQEAQKTTKASSTDTVTISRQALQMIAGNSDSKAESKESSDRKGEEGSRGRQ